jgi:hypothetical protein
MWTDQCIRIRSNLAMPSPMETNFIWEQKCRNSEGNPSSWHVLIYDNFLWKGNDCGLNRLCVPPKIICCPWSSTMLLILARRQPQITDNTNMWIMDTHYPWMPISTGRSTHTKLREVAHPCRVLVLQYFSSEQPTLHVKGRIVILFDTCQSQAVGPSPSTAYYFIKIA